MSTSTSFLRLEDRLDGRGEPRREGPHGGVEVLAPTDERVEPRVRLGRICT
jgi:hypothetical protein